MSQSKTSSPASYQPRFQVQFLLPKYWLTWFGLLLLWLLSLMPWQLRSGLAKRLGSMIYARNNQRKKVATINLQMVFPDKSEAERQAILQQYYRNLVQSMLDYGVLWWGRAARLKRIISIEGLEHITACRERGESLIMLTGHSVALDYGATALTQFFPSVGLVKPSRNPLIDWLMSRGRLRFQATLFQRDDGLRPVLKAMKTGKVFYYLPDEDLSHVEGSDWVFAPFFGVPTATITALGRLARMGKARVLPAMSYYEGKGRYVLRIHPPLKDYPSGDPQEDAMRQNQALETLVAEAPEQYMWTLTLFRKRPDGAPIPYL